MNSFFILVLFETFGPSEPICSFRVVSTAIEAVSRAFFHKEYGPHATKNITALDADILPPLLELVSLLNARLPIPINTIFLAVSDKDDIPLQLRQPRPARGPASGSCSRGLGSQRKRSVAGSLGGQDTHGATSSTGCIVCRVLCIVCSTESSAVCIVY